MKIVNAIICEDVRVENNGKHILIGVFTTDLVTFGDAPTVVLALWFQAEAFVPGEAELSIRATLSGETVFSAGAEAILPDNVSRVSFTMPGLPIIVKQSGDLKFELRGGGEKRWKTLVSLPVILNPSSPNASPQPS